MIEAVAIVHDSLTTISNQKTDYGKFPSRMLLRRTFVFISSMTDSTVLLAGVNLLYITIHIILYITIHIVLYITIHH